jgi:hypothetical protein
MGPNIPCTEAIPVPDRYNFGRGEVSSRAWSSEAPGRPVSPHFDANPGYSDILAAARIPGTHGNERPVWETGQWF